MWRIRFQGFIGMVCSVLLIVCLCVFAEAGEVGPGSLAYLDAKNGFRDLKFGTPPHAEMVLIGEENMEKLYTRPVDDMTIGGAQVEEILYGYYRDLLYVVQIRVKGEQNSRMLLDVMRQAYGLGDQPNQFLDDYVWFGQRVTASYRQLLGRKDAVVYFFSVSIQREIDTEQKAKAKKGIGDL